MDKSKPSSNEFPQKTVFHRITSQVPTVTRDKSIKEAIDVVLSHVQELATINYLYVISKTGKLVGALSIKELFAAERDKPVDEVMVKNLVVVRRRSRQETAVLLALKHSIKAVPVVDKKGKFVGVVTSDTLLNILHQEATEDILHFSGTYVRDRDFHKLSPWSLALARLPWIIGGMIGGVLAGIAVSLFGVTLKTAILISVFIPLMMGTSGNIGAQSAVIFIRSLITHKISIFSYLGKELQVGILLGTIAAMFIFIVSSLWFQSLTISLIVAFALFLNSILVVTVGVAIPWTLSRLKLDPAVGTAPFVTAFTDVMSLVVYLGLATAVLFWLVPVR